MSSSSHSDVIYKVQTVQFNGYETRILCHDPTHPCPPLIAACNHFLLTKPSYLNLADEGESISQSNLRKKLASLMDKAHSDYKHNNPESYEKMKETIHEIPKIAQFWLLDDTNLQPFNTRGTQDFSANVQTSLFHFLGVTLHHGWIVEPTETRICDAIGVKSSAELKTAQHSVIKKFLKDSRTELTSYGISCLTDALNEEELAGLYRKDHISLFYKHKGTLYVLETNKDRLNSSPGAMWKSLTLAHRDEVFFTSEFIPLPADKQPNKSGTQWVIDREAEAAAAAKENDNKEEDEKKKRDEQKKKKRDKQKSKQMGSKECQDTEMGRQSSADESTQAPLSETIGSTHVPLSEIIAVTWVERDFLKFLEGFTYEEGEVPIGENKELYFVVQMDFMKHIRSFDFSVQYAYIEKFNKELASAICSDKNRLTEVLTQTIIEFLINHGFGEETIITQKPNLIIHDVPAPESVQSFIDFVNGNVLVWPYQLYDKKWVNATTFIGRRMGKGYVDEILRNHKEGRCWAGKFEESNMKVMNGRFVIDKYAVEALTQQHMVDDLVKLIKILSKYYVSTSTSSAPAYFEQFRNDVMQHMPNHETDPEKFKKFQKYLSNHFAIKAPLVRSTVLRELFVVCQSLRVALGPNGKLVKGYKPLQSGPLDPWNHLVDQDCPYFDVYYFENNAKEDRFGKASYWNVLQYSCYFTEHMLDYTKDNGVQQVKDIKIVDLMLADRLEAAVANLILEMMYSQYDDEFSSVWRHFEESDYNDDPENADAGRGGPESVPAC